MKLSFFPSGILLAALLAAAGCATSSSRGHAGRHSGPALLPLKSYSNGKDFYTTARGEQDALKAGYHFVRIEGYIFTSAQTGTVPLKQYWSDERQDHYLLADEGGERFAETHGYKLVRTEGYLYEKKQPGTTSLRLFWSDKQKDNAAIGNLESQKIIIQAGYQFHRVEGFLFYATDSPPLSPKRPAPITNEVPRQL